MLNILSRKDPSLALCIDQYELTMALGYWKNGMVDTEAAFHMFFRDNPFKGGFVISAGLGPLIEFLREFRFSEGDLAYLSTLRDRADEPLFEPTFLKYLGAMRFECDLHAVPEGTVVFPNEPLIRVQGPIMQAQLVESLLLNTINFQSLIATKAARVCLAAEGDPVVDFGLRRAQGPDGGFSASRATYVGGCTGTSNVLAGKLLGIPVVGTHAHSWVMAFEDEPQAFAAFAHAMPNNCVFLVDTYGSHTGIRNAIGAAMKLRESGHEMVGIRLDSGDLAYFSKLARRLLDEAGLTEAVIVASNELDEYVVRSLKRQGAKIGAWGVGTKLVTAYSQPALSGVYKLTAIRGSGDNQWRYRLKLSEQKYKISTPGLLQVNRYFDAAGKMTADAVADVSENGAAVDMIIDPNDNTHHKKLRGIARVEPLLKPIFEGGKLVFTPPALSEIRQRVQAQLALLDDSHKRFENPHIYPVGLSPELNRIRDQMIHRERDRANGGG